MDMRLAQEGKKTLGVSFLATLSATLRE